MSQKIDASADGPPGCTESAGLALPRDPGVGVGWGWFLGCGGRQRRSGCPTPAAHLALRHLESFLKTEEEPAAWEAEAGQDIEQRAGEDSVAVPPREQAQKLAGAQKPP